LSNLTTSFVYIADADLYIDIARVYEDESMTIEYVIDERDTGNVTSGRLSCPLRISTVFHSVGRRRFEEYIYAHLITLDFKDY
jgi:hypothetical protein